MAYSIMAYIVMACIVMAYIVMAAPVDGLGRIAADIVMAYISYGLYSYLADIVMPAPVNGLGHIAADIVMAYISYGLCRHGLYRYGLCSYGLCSYGSTSGRPVNRGKPARFGRSWCFTSARRMAHIGAVPGDLHIGGV